MNPEWTSSTVPPWPIAPQRIHHVFSPGVRELQLVGRVGDEVHAREVVADGLGFGCVLPPETVELFPGGIGSRATLELGVDGNGRQVVVGANPFAFAQGGGDITESETKDPQ